MSDNQISRSQTPAIPGESSRSQTPAILLLIEDSDDIDATVRSGEREVLRWSPAGPGPGCFAGDLAREATYECARDAHTVTAVIDLAHDERAEAALRALRAVRPDAAVLVLSQAVDHAPGDGTLTRAGTLRDVLRLDLDEELRRLEAQRRAYCLRAFAAGDPPVPVLIHPDADPDAISSALAVRALLGGDAKRLPVVSLGGIRRPENVRMAELLGLEVREVTPEELMGMRRLITVDMQPTGLVGEGAAIAVIDHHPPERGYQAEFRDVRSDYGATASMLTEYLRGADADLLDAPLATALLYGIKTDTDSLTRGVNPPDVAAYAFLQARADLQLLRRLERPSFPVDAAQRVGTALAGLQAADGVLVAHAGELPPEWAHLPAEIADFCMAIEAVTLGVATAHVDDELVFTIRYTGSDEDGAGGLARRIAAQGGRGGGHATMARAALPIARAVELIGDVSGAEPLLRFVQELAEGAALSRRS